MYREIPIDKIVPFPNHPYKVRDDQDMEELTESIRANCMSKFHNYSLNNTMLIAMQRPDATLVSGYRAWQKNHGRTVKKGEKGIQILAPCKFKVELEPEQEGADPKIVERTGFKVAYVFDVRIRTAADEMITGIDAFMEKQIKHEQNRKSQER